MEKLGLVFSGGGGKGAYQIGVWKALREFGIDSQIQAVSGTSVGGLNAALFMTGELEKSIDIWKNIRNGEILQGKGHARSLFENLGLKMLLLKPYLLPFVIPYYLSNGFFSNRGIERILQSQVNLDQISQSPVDGFVTCCKKNNINSIKYIKLNDRDEESLKSLLLATSAIPFVYPPIEIDGSEMIDGGTRSVLQGLKFNEGFDNVPIVPLYHSGCDHIIVIHCSVSTIVDHSQFPNANITEIFPSRNLGGMLTGTLDFSSKGAEERMHLVMKIAAILLSL